MQINVNDDMNLHIKINNKFVVFDEKRLAWLFVTYFY